MKVNGTPTLLQMALAQRHPPSKASKFTDQDLELIEAYLMGDISLTQVKRAKGMPEGGVVCYTYIATGAREIWQREIKKAKR